MSVNRVVPRLLLAVAAVLLAVVAAPQAGAQTRSLTTTFDATNFLAGNTFDLEVRNPGGIEIESLDLNVIPVFSTGHVEVWTRPGTAVGSETSPSGWTSRGGALVTSAGEDNPSPASVSFSLPRGHYGVAIAVTDFPYLAMRTADGGPTTFENADLKLVSGSALWAPPFSSMTSERIWSGRINYSALTGRCKALESELESARAEADAARERIVVLRAEAQRARGALRSAKGSGTPAEVRRARVRLRRARKALEGARMNLRSRMEAIDQIRSDLNQSCRD